MGYCLLYTGSSWTLCRGSNAALFASSLLLTLTQEETILWKRLMALLLFMVIMFSVQIYGYFDSMTGERQSVAANSKQIINEVTIFTQIMNISPENSRWDNTAATYGHTDYRFLASPTGM